MNAEYFIDTNVFVYQIERLDARKFAVAGSIIERAIASGDGCVSFQVVQETLNVASRKSQRHAPEDDLRFYLDTVLAPLLRVPATVDLYHRALDIQSRLATCSTTHSSLRRHYRRGAGASTAKTFSTASESKD